MKNLSSRQHHISGGAANKFLQLQTEKTVSKTSYHKEINCFLINVFCMNIKDKVTGENKSRNHRVQNRVQKCHQFIFS